MHRKSILYGLTGLVFGSVAIALALVPVIKTPFYFPQLIAKAQTTSGQATPVKTPSMPGMRMGQSDPRFMVMMIPHHQDAIAMADLALTKAKHPELKTLAQSIKRDQSREIQAMRTWYKKWYGSDVPVWNPDMGRGMGMMGRWNQAPGKGGSGMGCGMAGVDLAALRKAPDFDRAFIEQMIPHHQMAVMMTHMIWSSQHPEMRTLATAIAKTQSAEINQMEAWYRQWYP
jgi:uncharacterized protein (DUF305 family)